MTNKNNETDEIMEETNPTKKLLFGFVSLTKEVEIRDQIFHCIGLDNKQINYITKKARDVNNQVLLYAELVVRGVVDPVTHNRIFEDKEVVQVLNFPFDVNMSLGKEILKLSGLGEDVDKMDDDINQAL